MAQNWARNEEGGYFANTTLSRTTRHAAQPIMKFRQFVRIEPGYGKGKGDSLDFNKIGNVQTQGGKLSEQSRIPQTKMLIQRGTLVVDEYGNSIPYTGKLEALSAFDVNNIITKGLRDDMAKVIDTDVGTQFTNGDVKYIPTGLAAGTWDTDGTASTSATKNMTLFHVKEIVDALKTGNFGSGSTGNNPCPAYDDDGNYICIASVPALRGLYDDPEWQSAAKYGAPERLFSGEVGKMYHCRFVETNHTGTLSATAGTSSDVGEAVFFGSDPVIEGLVIPEEIRAKAPEDYGRDKGVAWYFLGGWKRVWDLSTDSECHIVHFTSS